MNALRMLFRPQSIIIEGLILPEKRLLRMSEGW